LEDIKKCFSKKVIISSLVAGSLVLSTGAYLGAKYLNKSQNDFNLVSKALKLKNEKINELTILNTSYSESVKNLNSKIEDMTSWKDNKSFVVVNKNLLETNLKLYTKLSPIIQKLMIDTIIHEAKKYNINPIILYSLLHVESTMRFQIQHSLTTITIKGKKLKIRAVGLGGVVWEWWGDKLRKEKIAYTRSDLFLPDVNIKAVAFVLNEMYKKPLLKGTKSKDESMLRRYFGGNYKSYSDKIDLKVMSIVKPNLYRY
jgi:hypothetical protein